MTTETELKQRLGRAIGAVGEIPAGYAYLGNSSRVIVSSFPNRTVYISGTNLGAEAKLAQNISLLSINNTKYAGARVKLGYPNYDQQVLYVTAFDTGEGVSALNGLMPPEQHTQDAIYPDIGKILNGRLTVNNPTDLNIHVAPFAYYDLDGHWRSFGGDGLDTDFTADIAALSGEHQMAVVYYDVTTRNLGYLLSTAVTGGEADKDTLDASTIEDLVSAAGYIFVGAVHLYDGQTTIEETDIYRTADPRVVYPTPLTSVATLTTSNNTQTTIASIAVSELQHITITGTFSGVKSDYSAAISGTFVAGVRRATAGDATLVGVTVTSNEDSGGTPSFTVDADTVTDTARMRCTGITAETWNWVARYQTLLS